MTLVQRIIDLLQDDVDALRACSMTCKTLLPLCRVHLFRTVEARTNKRIQQLSTLVEEHPRVVPYIRNVVIKRHADIMAQPDKRIFWVLHGLASADSVIVADWEAVHLSQKERVVLRDCFAGLTSVTLRNVKMYPGDLQRLLISPALRAFAAVDLSCRSDVSHSRFSQPVPAQSGLVTLRCHSGAQIDCRLLAVAEEVIHTPALERLEILVTKKTDAKALGRLFSRARSMTHLVVGFSVDGPLFMNGRRSEICTLRNNTRLESLHIVVGEYASGRWHTEGCDRFKLTRGALFWLSLVEAAHQHLKELCITVHHKDVHSLLSPIDAALHGIAVNRPDLSITLQVVDVKAKGNASQANKMRTALRQLTNLFCVRFRIVYGSPFELESYPVGGPRIADDWKKKKGLWWIWTAPYHVQVFQ